MSRFTISPVTSSVISPSSLYDNDRWHAVVRDGFGIVTKRLSVRDGKSEVANFPVMHQRKAIFNLVGIPLRGTHTEFGGSFASDIMDVDVASIITTLHDHLLRHKASWVELIFVPDQLGEDSRAKLVDLGYLVEAKHSLVVDLDCGVDAVWAGFVGRARTEIRKAEKNGLSVVRLGLEHMADYMGLVDEVFAGQGRKPSFDQRFLNAVNNYLDADDFCHHGIFADGKLVAGGLFFRDAGRMVFVSGASDSVSRKLGANSLLQWVAIKDAMASGITLYDMGGIGLDGIDKFKTSFGGTPVTYDRYVWRSFAARLPAEFYKFAHMRGWVG